MPKYLIVGLDVGGTKIHAGLVTPQGRVLKRFKVPTEASKGRSVILKNIEAAICGVWHNDVRAIGVGLAGIVDAKKGIYLQGPNFPRSFRNISVAKELKRRFSVPVMVDNDVHCFTLGESRFGAGKGHSLVVGLTLGTGIGGGIVIDGRLYRGKNNAAGEVGHMIIGDNARDFEDLASGTAMARMYAERTGVRLDALSVERAALKGDQAAIETISIMRNALAVGIANIIHVLNPEVVIIGGGVSRMKALWSGLSKRVRSHLVYPQLAKTPIKKAVLGDTANVVGAALLTTISRKD